MLPDYLNYNLIYGLMKCKKVQLSRPFKTKFVILKKSMMLSQVIAMDYVKN